MAKTLFVLFFLTMVGCGGSALPKYAGVTVPLPSPPLVLEGQTKSCGHHQVIRLDLVPLDETYTVSVDGRQVKIQLFHMVDNYAMLHTTDIVRLMSLKGYRPVMGAELAALDAQHPQALKEGKEIVSLARVTDSRTKVSCPAIRMKENVRSSFMYDDCGDMFVRGASPVYFALTRK